MCMILYEIKRVCIKDGRGQMFLLYFRTRWDKH